MAVTESAETIPAAEDIILISIIITGISIIKKATNEAANQAFSVQEVLAAFSVADDYSIFFRKKIRSARNRLC